MEVDEIREPERCCLSLHIQMQPTSVVIVLEWFGVRNPSGKGSLRAVYHILNCHSFAGIL